MSSSRINTTQQPGNGYALAEETRLNFERTKAEINALMVAAARYTHEQTLSSAAWVVTHNLGRKPQVTVVDSGNTAVLGAVAYVDDNTLTISFSAPFSGRAYLA